MIKINLLPVRAAKKREFGRQQIVLFGLLLVLAAIGNWFWYGKVESELTALDQIHAEIAVTAAFSNLVNGNDQRVIEAGRCLGFAAEAP